MKRHFELASMILATTLMVACSGGAERDSSGRVIEEADVVLSALRVGDCFSDYKDPLASSTDVAAVRLVPCDRIHTYELYHVFKVGRDTDAWPGTQALIALVQKECYAAFEPYVGAR